MKIWAIVINTFREAIRNKILYTVLLFVAVLLAAAAFFGSVTIGDQSKVIKDFGLFSLSFFGAVLTIITGVTLLNRELKQKTIYNILSKPVSRWEFMLGKHLGLTLTVSLLVAAMGVGLFGFVGVLEGRPDWLLFQGITLAVLEVVVLSSIVLFFSSMAVTTTLPGIFTLATYIAGHSIAYLTYFVQGEPSTGTLANYMVSAFSWLLPDLSLFNQNALIVYGTPVSGSHFSYALIYAVAYSIAALTLASAIFNNRELN